MRVVVIDDNVDIAIYLDSFLRHEGHDVVLVTERFEEVCTQDGFFDDIDAALIDLRLGGERLASSAEEQEEEQEEEAEPGPEAPRLWQGGSVLGWMAINAPHVRRIVLSAYTDYVEVKELAHDVLTKPASAGEICRALERARSA